MTLVRSTLVALTLIAPTAALAYGDNDRFPAAGGSAPARIEATSPASEGASGRSGRRCHELRARAPSKKGTSVAGRRQGCG